MRFTYKTTIFSCFVSAVVQAIIVNYAPLLFITFQSTYHIPITQITLLIAINFIVQLSVDFLSGFFVDKIGYRYRAVCGCIGNRWSCGASGDHAAVYRLADRCHHLCHRWRFDRSADKSHYGKLPYGQQGKGHEFDALLLLLGTCGRCAAFHCVFCAVWY